MLASKGWYTRKNDVTTIWWFNLRDTFLSSINDDAPMIQRYGAWQMMPIHCEMKFGHFRTRCCSLLTFCTHPALPPYRCRNFSGIASDAEWYGRSCSANRRLATRTMFGVRPGTTDVTECRILPVSRTETSALLRFQLLFLDLGTEQYDQRALFAFDRTRCLLTRQRSAIEM